MVFFFLLWGHDQIIHSIITTMHVNIRWVAKTKKAEPEQSSNFVLISWAIIFEEIVENRRYRKR
jgi:hypothetical protein